MPPFSGNELNNLLNDSLRNGDFPELQNNSSALKVFNITRRELENSGYNEEPWTYDNKYQTLEAVKENFNQILSQLNRLRAAKRKVVKNFPKWKPNREQTIKELKEFALNINWHRKNCNISKLVCTSVSVVGGGLTVAGVVLTALTAGIASPLLIAGLALSGSGGAATFGTSMTEVGLETSNMNAGKATLKKDEESFSVMEEWFKCSQDLQNAIDKVIGYEALREILVSLQQIGDDISKISDSKLSTIIRNILSLFKTSLPHLIQLAPFILTYIYVIVSSVRNRYLFDSLVFINRSLSGIVFLVDLLTDGAALGLKGVKLVNAAVANAVARGALTGFALALDITTIVVTSIDVHKGSKSKNAEYLLKCAEALQTQLDFLGSMYEELKKKRSRA